MSPRLPMFPMPGHLAGLARAAGRWLGGWWRVVHLGALLLALALSPSSYTRERRQALARHLVAGTAPALLPFLLMATLISVVLIRIVVVTAISYGLSQYALEMVVRVLVLELIPLTAALFAALDCTFPQAAEVARLRARGEWDEAERAGRDPLRTEALPRVGAGVFCALMLASLSSVVALVVSYLTVYGFSDAGFAAYTRTVGQVFNPAVSLIFGLKIVLLGAAVALLPLAAVLDETPRRAARTSVELQGLLRLFVVILLIEAASLVGNYY